jgi:valyl-tRNA synthetase
LYNFIYMENTYDREKIEDKWKKYWEKKKIFEFRFEPKKPLYIVDTPPPYVSADHLHAGHIMSYSQAEFIVRFKRMRGYCVYYPMGFDDNGLPTERFVEKKYKLDKSKIKKSEFVKLCLKETEIGSKTYKKLWNDLGISVDWSKTYSTISLLAQKISQWSIIDLYENGHLYRSEDPILWCPFCQTALAQADLEDKEEDSYLNFINFEGEGGQKLTVATTRPELLAACVSLYANPKDKRYSALVGKKVKVPIFNYVVEVRTSEKVDPDFGTGLVMTCTWGDQEDLEKWKTDKLDTRKLFTVGGKLSNLGGNFEGLSIVDARRKIIEELKRKDLLVKSEKITHFVNTHERCSTPVEFIASKQWFVKVSENKDDWLKRGRELNWYPKSRKKDFDLWVKSLKWDWCVSRQRYFGVPIPFWYCGDCGEVLYPKDSQLPVNPSEEKFPGKTCIKCKSANIVPDEDVLDTWATSSLTPLIIKELVNEKSVGKKLYPSTLRPNAFEIIRTWDFYTIVKSHYHFDALPFADIMISGHGLDEQGRKFSKRLGNYIPSDSFLKMYGADAIRYWATGAKLGTNLRFSEGEVEKGKKTAIKLWNVARFTGMHGTFGKSKTNELEFEDADLWIISKMNEAIKKSTDSFEKYTYAKSRDVADLLFWSYFADYYIEFVKYRLYGKDSKSKKSAIFTLNLVFENILKLYAPIMPFVTEEIYQSMYKGKGETSIHLTRWPTVFETGQKADIKEFEKAVSAIEEIRKYKSLNKISLGKEIESYKLTTKVDLGRYRDFICKAIRVKKLLE